MGDVTGPISTLPGSSHALPNGTMCDRHPDRPAIARVQGETDSFGSEMNDVCKECLDADPVHRVCGSCSKKQQDRLREENERWERENPDYGDDWTDD